MQQFDLSLWLQDKSRKVVTRNGKPVRIVCWGKLGEYPIIGCVKYSDDYEDLESYDSNGFKYSFDREDQNDLFFADEEEKLNEFEKEVKRLMKVCGEIGKTDIDSDWVYEESKDLLDLARKELQSEHRLSEDTPYSAETEEEREAKIKSTVDYEKGLYDGYEQGKQDALKDLPKWKKAKKDKVLNRWVVKFDKNGNIIFSDVLYKGEYFIMLQSLKTLPKEE